MTVKAGQKCTAIKRIIVPENLVEDVKNALTFKNLQTTIGDPKIEGVRMGGLAGKDQESEVSEKINLLKKSQSLVYQKLDLIGADRDKGSFVPPTLFLNENLLQKQIAINRSFWSCSYNAI